ncbi:glycyl-radical enzyme activating protein [Snodgrassella sp. B3882]|uniref:glycyl-radical enzyme activating protein n=1 Tax=Snodgrassella sp. B3882 TaxID=2818037 RepID=UPI0022697EE3|nr:glycyl-radical enzyme activating protein [Snodgrassella sp. B3882]MCX8743877.1 glycyl-radical enzyme activating protein [Snodgrassella sp. B3882]
MEKIEYDLEGTVFNIQRYSLHDGPGIRTIPFLKGCPLACKWCSNPESQKPQPEIMYQKSNCIHCGKCFEACRYGALSKENPYMVDRDRCVACGACAEVCPTNALVLKGKKMTVWEVIHELQKDENIYRRSDGGITLSGGESLSQPKFTRELLRACKERGWHTAIETTGMTTKEIIESVMPFVDLALTDIKIIDPSIHKNVTGVDNQIILENLIRISNLTKTIVRIPVIPNVNDNIEAIREIAEFTKLMKNINEIHLLPYHNFGENKYNLLGRIYPLHGVKELPKDKISLLKQEIEKFDIACQIGG